MGSNASVFNMDNFTVTRVPVPNPGGDSSVPAISQGAGSGNRITGAGFLSAPNLEPGQDQVLVHTGNQSVLLDQERHTTVAKDEEYNNLQKMTHNITQNFTQNVHGPFEETHYKTTTALYKGDWDATYLQKLSTHEAQPQTRTRRTNEFIHQEGSSTTEQWGPRTFFQQGINISTIRPFRLTNIQGLEIKTAVVDLGIAPYRHAVFLAEGKTGFAQMKAGVLKVHAKVVDLNIRGFLVRTGGMCLKAAAWCLGNIRW